MLWLMNAGGIDKDQLGIICCQNPLNSIAGRLRFVAHDGDFSPNHPVKKSGFAHIGTSDNGNKTRFIFLFHVHPPLKMPTAATLRQCEQSFFHADCQERLSCLSGTVRKALAGMRHRAEPAFLYPPLPPAWKNPVHPPNTL